MHGRIQRQIEPDIEVTSEQLDLWQELGGAEAREHFYAFRQLLRPDMLIGWWQRIIAGELQYFYERLMAGKRPYLVIASPPQHGKTSQVTEFIAWASGQNPHLKTIYTSYSDDLGISVNRQLQRIYDDIKYHKIFPKTRLWASAATAPVPGRPQRNASMLEYVNYRGFFRNTTVEGQITGQGLELGVVDDPIKGRAEAQSKRNRDKIWNWLVDDFFTRFAENAGMIFIMTRWHIDDPVARFLERFPSARVVSFPAIATQTERYRNIGDPLFPEHKSLEFLLERKHAMTLGSWEALYQQHPIVVGGDIFPIDRMTTVPRPLKSEIRKSVRFWDKGGTSGGGAFTAGVLMHELKDKSFVVSDVRHGQWSYAEREQRIKQTAEIDKETLGPVTIWVEQEPGSGGKESAERTIASLRGHRVFADKVTGSKEVRAEPYAAQCQGGNVHLVAGTWNMDFLDEHEAFPNGKYKDQVDAAAGAFNKLTVQGYDVTMQWAVA